MIVATGNITNRELIALLEEHLGAIVAAHLVEPAAAALTVHDRDEPGKAAAERWPIGTVQEPEFWVSPGV